MNFFCNHVIINHSSLAIQIFCLSALQTYVMWAWKACLLKTFHFPEIPHATENTALRLMPHIKLHVAFGKWADLWVAD